MTLVLGLKKNERLLVDQAVVWLERKKGRTRVCVDAPREVEITREGAKSWPAAITAASEGGGE